MPVQELSTKWDIEPLPPELDTLPKHLLALVRHYGDRKVAMRKKRYGIWQEYTWRDSFQHIHDFALGLLALGLKRGEKIGIIGDNDPEYYWAELAAQSVGLTVVGVFTDAAPRELSHVIDNSDIRLIVAHDQEQVDKVLELRDSAKNVVMVVYWDDRGLFNYHDDWLMSFGELESLGQEYGKLHPATFEQEVKKGHGDEYAIFSYTSGTTGLPKAAMIQHKALIYGAWRQLHPNQYLKANEDYVSFSPMAWIAEQGIGVTSHVVHGIPVNFPEKPETVQNDIREIAPHALLFPSRLWESFVSQVQARMVDANWINRKFYDWFLPVGYKIADMQDCGESVSLWWKFLYFLGDLALFAPLRDKMGLSRTRFAYTGGAALSPDVIRFFRALNIQLLQIYGSTECQTHTSHALGDLRFGTVGQPPPGIKIKITEDGEIAIKSHGMFTGYYKAPEKTAEVLIDGWYHTGDSGYIDPETGHLIYLDRMSDMIQLGSGEKYSPQYIEGRLKFSPYIQDVMAVGSFDMPYVSALITLNFDNIARWAEKNGIAFTTIVDLSQKPRIAERIKEEVERVNKTLQPGAKIRRFVILHKTFDADEAELTRTRKLRRRYLEQRYGDILSAIYGRQDQVTVQSEVVYQDGRKGMTEQTIHIHNAVALAEIPVVQPARTLEVVNG